MNSSPTQPHFRHASFVIGCFFFLVFHGSMPVEAWIGSRTTSLSLGSMTAQRRTTATKSLFYSSESFENNEFGNNNFTDHPFPVAPQAATVVERLGVNGVSVSPKGFHVLLVGATSSSTNNNINNINNSSNYNSSENILPLKVTNDPADARAATSPESLTLCQLLSGVDMGGAILPPELLGKIVLGHIEDKIDALYDDDDDNDEEEEVFRPALSAIEAKIWEYVKNQEALLREQKLFGSTQQQRAAPTTTVPKVTLDQLVLVPSPSAGGAAWGCRLECALPEWKETIAVDVRVDLLASLAYNFDPESSPLFTCIALALRYKAPIVLERPAPHGDESSDRCWFSGDDLDKEFPQRKTLESLRQPSTRVTQNIERGFEIHKLTGALEIALRLGDTKAASKIRAKLDEYDSLEDLPVIDDGNDDRSRNGNRLDDLDNNILQ